MAGTIFRPRKAFRFPNRRSNGWNIALLLFITQTEIAITIGDGILFFLFFLSLSLLSLFFFYYNGYYNRRDLVTGPRIFFPGHASYGGRETVVKGRADSNSSGADVNSPEKDKHVGTRYVMRDREATVIYNSCNQLAKRNDNLVTPRYSLLRPLDRLPLPGTRFSPLPLSDVFPLPFSSPFERSKEDDGGN